MDDGSVRFDFLMNAMRRSREETVVEVDLLPWDLAEIGEDGMIVDVFVLVSDRSGKSAVQDRVGKVVVGADGRRQSFLTTVSHSDDPRLDVVVMVSFNGRHSGSARFEVADKSGRMTTEQVHF